LSGLRNARNSAPSFEIPDNPAAAKKETAYRVKRLAWTDAAPREGALQKLILRTIRLWSGISRVLSKKDWITFLCIIMQPGNRSESFPGTESRSPGWAPGDYTGVSFISRNLVH